MHRHFCGEEKYIVLGATVFNKLRHLGLSAATGPVFKESTVLAQRVILSKLHMQ